MKADLHRETHGLPRVVLADGSRFKGTIDTEAKSAAQRTAVPPAPPKAAVEV